MRLALIPARGGSKRLPRKNIIPFAGQPMIAWTIRAAQESQIFDLVVVSTDDKEIANIVTSFDATVSLRPHSISNDAATLVDVVHYTLARYPETDDFCLLLPNCPLRPADEIVRSEHAWRDLRPPALISVVDYSWTPPFRAQKMDNNHKLSPLMPNWMDKKSQLYPESVCPSGAIYWGRAEKLRVANTLYIEGVCGFKMPWYLAVDIDTRDDLDLAKCFRFSFDHGYQFRGTSET